MPEQSPRLNLPYMQPSQAQKHVTHNEALQRLDAVAQIGVVAFDAETPPAIPSDGAMYALGAQPQGGWAGQAHKLAYWDGLAWHFIVPVEGWLGWGAGEQELRAFHDGAWQQPISSLNDLQELGIGTSADSVNRLAVVGEASLFSNAGAGHQIKINKAQETDTASVLFQSGWTGHAEMGLAGVNDWSIKISPDGNNWHEALRMEADDGRTVFAPDGTDRVVLDGDAMQVDVPLTGTAVQAAAMDETEGRVLTVGAFGIGNTDSSATRLGHGDGPLPTGFYSGSGGSAASSTFPTSGCRYQPFLTLNRRISDGAYSIKRIFFEGDKPVIWSSTDTGASWSNPNILYGTDNLLGNVAFDGGEPTGAVIERGGNANGDYVRFADGTQICTAVFSLGSVVAAGAGSFADPYRTALSGWVLPSPFIAAPVVTGTPSVAGTTDLSRLLGLSMGQVTATEVADLQAARQSADATDLDVTVALMAVGRWH